MINVYTLFIILSKIREDETFEIAWDMLSDENPVIKISGEEVITYAVSNRKDYIDEFLNTRNASKFILTKKKMSEDEWLEYSRYNFERMLSSQPYSFHDKVIDVVTTAFENNMYTSLYDGIDDELETLNIYDMSGTMEIIYQILKKKYVKVCDDVGIANVLNSIEGMNNGEPIYLEPDFFKFMMMYFKFTF